MNFTKLKDKIEEAAKQAFMEMFEKHGNEGIYAFALYSDEYAMTVCPSTNTLEHLAKKLEQDDEPWYKYGTAEWKCECEGAEKLFNDICALCRTEVERMEEDGKLNIYKGIFHEDFVKFQNQLYETCITVLEKLKFENFFKQIVGKDILLLFAVSDYEFDNEKNRDMVTRLNDNEYRDEYIALYLS